MNELFGFELATLLTALSILTVWFKVARVWQVCYALTIIVALIYSSIEPVALLSCAALLAALYAYKNIDRFRWLSFSLSIGLGLLFGLHVLVGFNNHEYLDSFRLNNQSAAFSIWFNYDKSFFGIVALGILFHDRLIRSWPALLDFLKKLIPTALVGICVVFAVGLAIGYATIDITFSIVFLPWALKNIFFTVLAEEMMFRGLIQTELSSRLSSKAYGDHLAILVGGVLFGAAHFAGGIEYVILSSLAGCLYGYTYKITGRIEAPILTHFALNALHFLFFSYPFIL